jgi:hypothetical protein
MALRQLRTVPQLGAALALAVCSAGGARAQLPDAIAALDSGPLVTLHAEGAQIYECKAGRDGNLVWTFREPIAALMLDGRTVGRHYVGPTWEHIDGSRVQGKVIGNRAARRWRLVRRRHCPAAQYRWRRVAGGL